MTGFGIVIIMQLLFLCFEGVADPVPKKVKVISNGEGGGTEREEVVEGSFVIKGIESKEALIGILICPTNTGIFIETTKGSVGGSRVESVGRYL